jgi:hypothetical protein
MKPEFNYVDYDLYFKSNSDTGYIISFIFYEDNTSPFTGKTLCNVSFTEDNQFDLTDEIYENTTKLHESIEVYKRILYIFQDFYNMKLKNFSKIFVIGDIVGKYRKKIIIYRNIIKYSLNDMNISFKETYGKSLINKGNKAYYYEILN